MKNNEKTKQQALSTKQLALSILDTADKLGYKDSSELLASLCLATVYILKSVSAYSTLSPKELASIYTQHINKII